MADVTISSLPLGTPSSSALLPYSTGSSTVVARPSAFMSAGLLTGTWQPYFCRQSDLVDIVKNSTYAVRDGRWTKIGNLVYIEAEIQTASFWEYSTGTVNGQLLAIGGLPFNTNYYTGNFACSFYSNFNGWTAGYTPMLLTQQPQAGKPSHIAMGYASTNGWTWAVTTLVASYNSRILFSGWYTADS